MTYVAEEIIAEREIPVADFYSEDESYMAIVDEFGQETPITERDIRRSLKQLSDAEDRVYTKPASPEDELNTLMHLAEAAREVV